MIYSLVCFLAISRYIITEPESSLISSSAPTLGMRQGLLS